MGISAVIAAGAMVIGGVVQADEARKARHSAEAAAEKQQQQLEELAAKPKPVIPVADDKAIQDAKRRSISDQIRRRGRASTILTDTTGGGDALGS